MIRAIILGVVAVLVFLSAFFAINAPDFWWHLANGEQTLSNRALHFADPFSYTTEGRSYPPTQWLFEIVSFAIVSAAGLGGAIIAKAILLALLFVVMGRTLFRNGADPFSVLALLLAGLIVTRFRFVIRPDLVTFMCVAIVWSVLYDYRRGRIDRLRWLPALFLVWVQFHSGALFGILVMGSIWVGEAIAARLLPSREGLDAPARNRLLKWTAISLFVTFLNPIHVKYISFALGHVQDFAKFAIQELRPIDWNRDPLQMIFLIAALVLAVRAARRDPVVLLTLLPVALVTFRSVRLMPIFVVLALPVMADAFQVPKGRGRTTPRVIAAVASFFFIAYSVRALDPGASQGLYQFGTGINRQLAPVAGADAIARLDPEGNLFNSNIYGGYLISRFQGERPVFTDGRSQLHEPTLRYIANHTWREIIAKYDIGHCLIDHKWAEPRLPGNEMSLVWWDDTSMLYISRDECDRRDLPMYTVPFPVLSGGDVLERIDPGRAEQELRRAIREAPRSVLPRIHLAAILGSTDRDEEGAGVLSKALEFEPWRGDVMINRGYLLARSGDRRAAIESLRDGLRRERKDGRAWGSLGRLLSEESDNDGAARALKRAVRIAPENQAFLLDLGLVYERQGKTDRAQDTYRSVVQRFPDSREAQRRLERLSGREP